MCRMNRPYPDLLLRAFALCLMVLPAAAQALASLSACASHTPPFVLFAKDEAVGGFSYELLQSLARQMGRKLQVSKLPWARCLQEVKSGAVDLAIDAYDDAQRRKLYWYSRSYHTLTPQIFYKAHALMDLKPIKGVQDLQPFKGCGVRDYTYEHYDLDATRLDRGAGDDMRMLQKLQAGHCDYAIEELEYIIGARASLSNWPDESGLKSQRPIWARGPTLHFLVGKERFGGEALLAKIDQAITGAEKSRQTAALRKKYFESGAKPATKP
jgi:polar amino acid transport system substrate-binding protein